MDPRELTHYQQRVWPAAGAVAGAVGGGAAEKT
jgi:hypothetical protein